MSKSVFFYYIKLNWSYKFSKSNWNSIYLICNPKVKTNCDYIVQVVILS